MIGSKLASLLVAFVVGFFGIGEGDAVSAAESPVPETPAVIVSEAPVETPEPTPSPSPKPLLEEAELEGDWYGYWEMISCTGAWAELENSCWDCCAQINESDVLWLWDVDVDKATGLASLEIAREGDKGSISGGWFMNQDEGYDQWRVELRYDDCGMLLVVRGNYVSEQHGNFSFVIYLRPWGDEWPESSRPDGYDSFYLPNVEANNPMPDSFY